MLRRPQYEARARLTAPDLALEQHYRWQHLRRHNRFLHGWGVVCGLQVIPGGANDGPLVVRVCPGYAISPCGDEIDLRCMATVDIAEWLWALRTPQAERPNEIWIAVRYLASEAAPAPVPPVACRCGPAEGQPSRLVDGIRIDVLLVGDLPAAPRPVDLCKGAAPDCGAVSVTSPYVPLARVLLPAAENAPVAPINIVNLVDGVNEEQRG